MTNLDSSSSHLEDANAKRELRGPRSDACRDSGRMYKYPCEREGVKNAIAIAIPERVVP